MLEYSTTTLKKEKNGSYVCDAAAGRSHLRSDSTTVDVQPLWCRWWQRWRSDHKHNEIFKNKNTQDIRRIPSEKIWSLENAWNSGNIHPWLFCQGNVTYCSWTTECLRMSFFLPHLYLCHASCPVYQFVCCRCMCMCVFDSTSAPYPLFLRLDPNLLGSSEYAITYKHLLSRFRSLWWSITDRGQSDWKECAYVCQCVLFYFHFVWCLSVFSHAEPFTSAWTHPHYPLVYLNWKF